jgi:4-nitrophenyl phosphatase
MGYAPWLASLRALLIDMDGVMYRGDVALPGSTDVLPTLLNLGIEYAFVTNNATLTPEQYRAKLAGMGVETVADRVVTSSIATAAYLASRNRKGARVCVVGEHGLVEALEEAGFDVADEDADFVVVGLDRQLTYRRLVAATRAIMNGAAFIATNADPAIPVEDGVNPGAGAIVASVATATGVPPTVIGKPEPTLLLTALERLGVRPEQAAMVGDQVQSDIRAGRAAGMPTVLVAGDLASDVPGVAPDLIVRDLGELLEILRAARTPVVPD